MSQSPASSTDAAPPLDVTNFATCLLAMEEFAIFRRGWEPAQAAYAVERLQEAARSMGERGEDVGSALMPEEALWCLFNGWGEVWAWCNGGGMSTSEIRCTTGAVLDAAAKLAALRDEIAAGMAWLEQIPERAEYAYRRMREADIPAKRRLHLDHPDYVSAGALFRLTIAFGEVWDNLSDFTP